ncbi:MAG: FDXHR family putative zinc-binding protein [Acidimicrobiales bacterium]
MTMTTITTTSCEACDHAAKHGWWGPTLRGGAHCPSCHRSWNGLAECHCTTCHGHFRNYAAADMHLRVSLDGENIEHLDPAKLLDKQKRPKMAQDERGIWHTARYGERPAHWARAS